MLAVSPLRCTTAKYENKEQMESFSTVGNEDFSDFSDKNLLESINFDDLFLGINDGDVLPDLEMDPEILAEFSTSGKGEDSEINTFAYNEKLEDKSRKEEEDEFLGAGSGSQSESGISTRCEGIVNKRDDSSMLVNRTATQKDGDKGRKSSKQTKNNHGKRKVKVNWTPELHRRFVQAVDQLGTDKAVPSRILEIMGIDCLTRHNIASHLQKYRSHRKHLRAREAEAASWSQIRKMYGTSAASGGGKRDMNPWPAPTMGFPPSPITPMHHPFRPLHVWGHPSTDQPLTHIWPKHLAHSPSPSPPLPLPHTWALPPPAPSYWHQHHRVPNPTGLTLGTPFFPQPLPPTRFATPPVPGFPPHTVYKVDPGIGFPAAQSSPHPWFDFYPSKESVDAVIGDALSKPWLPLPLGLKPPSLESVLVELQRQGIPKVPPTSCS
uniref:Putative transcription factor GLK1 n=1 Tax=Rhizophora mucronata TaxID=61149 RepID=A0A2P2K4H4_RHIMU